MAVTRLTRPQQELTYSIATLGRMRVRPAISLAVGLLVALAAGCGSGESLSIPVSTPSQPQTRITTAPAAPTGSGPALHQSYDRRCAASLSRYTPPRATSEGTLRELRLRSPDSSHTVRSIYVYRPGGVPENAR